MVIERAIEKLKKAGGIPDANPGLRNRARAPGQDRGRDSRVEPAPADRVSYPARVPDATGLEKNRIIDPTGNSDRSSPAHAAFRMLRSRLLNRIRTEGWTTLAVTSPGAAEGKTVVSINLALSLAREGSSDVFLLDLDMRNPSVARYLGVTPPREIIDYFSGESPPAELFFSVGPERLAIASGLHSTEHASEYLASSKFEELLDYIREVGHNPIILIDLPPLLVSDEGILLAPRVDAVSLVIAEGRTSRDGLVRAKQLLEGHTLAGVILNRSHDALAGAEYYSYGVRPKGSQ